MKNLLTDKNILIYRVIFAGLCWFTIITGWILSVGIPFSWLLSFRYYTMQTNIMVTIWFTLAIIWYNKPETLKKIIGPLKGAFTLYITTTFIFFAILLQMFYHPTGWAAFSNLVLHYITPVAFIVDWVLTETKIRYEWKYLPYWIIYPVCYLLFSLINGSLTGDYLYPFLDISRVGIQGYLISLSFLIGVGIGLACIYILVNRYRTKS
ncbi:MAG: Pr6Pr family membrane protein [Promethearchaeota archaeon]